MMRRAMLIRIGLYAAGLSAALYVTQAFRPWLLRQRAARIPPGAVVVLGDSIMAALDSGALGADMHNPGVHNLGLGGATTEDALGLLPPPDRLAGARAVVLGVGVNDIGQWPAARTLDNHAQLMHRLAASPALIVVGILPVDEAAPMPRTRPMLTNTAIDALNAAIAPRCAARPGCRFLDTKRAMADARGTLRADLHSGDGVHLSAAGNALLGALIVAALRE